MSKVKHIAFLKFKDTATAETVENLFNALLDLSENVDGVEDYVAGENTSPEGLSKGFTHAFSMSFRDAAARDAYLTHAEHEKFKADYVPFIADIAVVDFEV